jgi:hypothetical protein
MFRGAPTKAPGAPGAPAVVKTSTPSIASYKARARKLAEQNSPDQTPEGIKKAGDEAEAAADVELRNLPPDQLARRLTDSEDADVGPIGPQKTGSNKDQEDLNAKQESALTKKLKTPAGIALVAALGLTLAIVIAFIVKAAEAAKACTDARDFKITITSIKPTPSSIPLIGGLFKPSTVDVAYTCPTNYEPLEGKESFTFKDTGFPEMDDMTFTVEKVLGKNKVQVKCGTDDCSDLSGTKGAINPNCADFSARFNDQIEKAAEAAGDSAGSLFKGLFKNMGTVLFVIAIGIGFFFLITSLSKSN